MVEARAIRGPLSRAWTVATVAAVGLSSIGCTMCPDPFDYSGPVPNGSAPQNDFRARSNGILPLGAAGKPWPPIVQKATSQQAEEPTPALADDSDAVALQQTVAVMGESEEDSAAIDVAPANRAEDGPQPALEPVPAGLEPPSAQGAPEGQPQPPAPFPTTGPTGETPGWRARRR